VGANDPQDDPDLAEGETPGTHRGREIHILHAGDPGVAKTQVMADFAALHPGSKTASGSRCSVPGLIGTAAGNNAILGNSSVGIKPGVMALVSRGGILAMDELNSLAKGDKKATIEAMNEALESGKVTATMAFTGTVITKTPVQMVLNPTKGKTDQNKFDTESSVPLIDQIGIPGNTMSRMDLVYITRDEQNAERDAEIARSIQRNRSRGSIRRRDSSVPVTDGAAKWFAMCREILWVTVPAEIEDAIVEAYVSQRARRPSTNPRWTASLRRLIEAAARMHGREAAERQHFDFALRLLNESLLTRNPEMGEGGSGLTSEQTELYETVITHIRNFLSELATGERRDVEQTYIYMTNNWQGTNTPPSLNAFQNIIQHFVRNNTLGGNPRINPHEIWDQGRN
jgi:DNA replicative helicase MCM subunit Mcm2 (Cdc46/Mcm family)